MELAELVRFMRQSKLAVQASVTAEGAPQAAVIGFVVSDAGDLFFDTSSESRKARNLRRDPRVALVVGWDERTVQYEGIADEPAGDELARFKAPRASPMAASAKPGRTSLTFACSRVGRATAILLGLRRA